MPFRFFLARALRAWDLRGSRGSGFRLRYPKKRHLKTVLAENQRKGLGFRGLGFRV